ncbi:MAG: mechanosensitive ion channel family protein [Desulfobacterales bacterium]|nr:mechanosensitive ion channel family protein [Desulfobacterales bacterium]
MNRVLEFYHQIESSLRSDIPILDQLIKSALALLLFYIAWLVIKRITLTAERRATQFNVFKKNPGLFISIQKILRYALIMAAGTYLIKLYQILLVKKLFHALMVMLIASPAKEFLVIALKYGESHISKKTTTQFDDIVFDLLNKFAGAIVYVAAAVIALDLLGINVMPFIAGAGVAGVAIGFAAKDTLSNLIAGVLLIVDRPFEIGDRIEVWDAPKGSATWGDVIDIGLRATKIRTTDNIVIVIPNNKIMTRDIINYTLISDRIRVRINVGVAYNANIQKARDILVGLAQTVEWVAQVPRPKVVVRNFGDSSVDLQLRVWIDDARQRMNTISAITDKIKSAFDEAGIEIPFPKRDITIINPDQNTPV